MTISLRFEARIVIPINGSVLLRPESLPLFARAKLHMTELGKDMGFLIAAVGAYIANVASPLSSQSARSG
jgi:hypothetical protein